MRRLKTMTVKVTPALSAKVSRIARRRRTSQSEIVREALEAYAGSEHPSFTEAAEDYCGVAKGPGDLSTNPKYLDDLGK